MAELRLHLGVHKTGTTFLQRWLDRSQFIAGTRWVNEIEARQELTPNTAPPAWLDGDEDVVLSDENLLSFFQNFRNFSRPTERLSCLALENTSIFLGLRNYADFFASRWVQHVKRNRYRPFPITEPLSRRWPDLLRELAEMFPNSPITVWDYAHYAGNEGNIAQLISGNRIAEFGVRPHPTINQRLSESAILALSKLRNPPQGDAFRAFFAKHKITPSNPRFEPWTAELRTPFDAAYQQDWAEIAKYAVIWTPS